MSISSHNMAIAGGFSAPSTAAQQYIHQMNNDLANMAVSVPYIANFIQQSYEKFIDFTQGETIRKIESLYNKATNIFAAEKIVAIQYSEIGVMQNPPDCMIPYIMAIPVVREAYLEGTIDGYGDRYVSIHTGVGYDHFEYRYMTSGIVDLASTDERGFIRNSFEKCKPENPLTINDKMNMHLNTKTFTAAFQHGESDPTSPNNNSF